MIIEREGFCPKLNSCNAISAKLGFKIRGNIDNYQCLCRSIAADFKEDVEFKGLKGFKYSAGFGDMSKEEDLKCFCTTPETCWKQGLHDLTRCQGKQITLPNQINLFRSFFSKHSFYLLLPIICQQQPLNINKYHDLQRGSQLE